MPHIIIKMHAGRSDEQKANIADAVAKALIAAAGCSEKAVSVSIEDVPPPEWSEKVYRPDIAGKPETLFIKPGYEPL